MRSLFSNCGFQPMERMALCTARASSGSVGSAIDAHPMYTPSVEASSCFSKAAGSRFAVGHPSCFEPRWKPFTTLPANLYGPTRSMTRSTAAITHGWCTQEGWFLWSS